MSFFGNSLGNLAKNFYIKPSIKPMGSSQENDSMNIEEYKNYTPEVININSYRNFSQSIVSEGVLKSSINRLS